MRKWILVASLLFVALNFFMLFFLQRQLTDTSQKENVLKEKGKKLDIMAEELQKQREAVKKEEHRLNAQTEELNNLKKELKACKQKLQSNGSPSKQDDSINHAVVEPLPGVIPEREGSDTGGGGAIGAVGEESMEFPLNTLSISERLNALEDKNEILRVASHWLSAKINASQNPEDCSAAKWMYCPIMNNCGAGCVLHQLTYCTIVGFATGRIVVPGDGWKYLRECDKKATWTCMFKPVTHCSYSLTDFASQAIPYSDDKNDVKVVRVDLFTRANMNKNFFPWAASDGFHSNTPFWLPPEIEPVVRRLHGDPRIWLVGHLEKYLLRFNDKAQKMFNNLTQSIQSQWIHPIAGIHVRRTDHKIEAPYRDLPEYVAKVAEWFDKNDVKGQRTIYIATDEPAVLKEALDGYPQYKWLYYTSPDGVQSGASVDKNLQQDRSSMRGTMALFADWYFLSNVDFLVGTSSSQVTRLAYELMQTRLYDATSRFVSLDDPWYFP